MKNKNVERSGLSRKTGPSRALALAPGSRLSFVVVYGPPGTGKTLNRETLRKHYRCRAVLDDWPSLPRELRGQTGRVLILSNTEKVRDPYDRRRVLKARTVKIEDAAKVLGTSWVKPRNMHV